MTTGSGRYVARVAALLLAAGAAFGAVPAAAVVLAPTTGPYFQNLTFNSTIDINRGGSGYILDDGARTSSCCSTNVLSVAHGGANTTISVRVRAPAAPATQFVFLGYGADDAGQNHLVLALNTAFSASLVGKEFATVFTGYSEASLIDALIHQFDGSPQSSAASSLVSSFQGTLFGFNAGFASVGTFGITSFSTGATAGSGIASVTPIQAAPVPESATWAMMIGGFGAIGVGLRRRRVAVSFG